jgi:hypothetical protein
MDLGYPKYTTPPSIVHEGRAWYPPILSSDFRKSRPQSHHAIPMRFTLFTMRAVTWLLRSANGSSLGITIRC